MTVPETGGGAQPSRRKHGCLFYAGITLLGLALVGGVGGYLAVRYVLYRLVQSYTSTSPAVLPPPRLSAQETEDLRRRISSFTAALREGTPTAPLVLTADEINTLIASTPAWQTLGGAAVISIAGRRISGDVSIPCDRLGYPGRYFNASGTFDVSLRDGVMIVTMETASVRGIPLPDWLMSQLRQQNLAKDLYEKRENAELLRKFESIEVRDGRVIIQARAKEPAYTPVGMGGART